MNLERKIRLLGRSINVIYYTIYLLVIVAVIVFFFLTYTHVEVRKIDPQSSLASNLQTVYILYLLLSIPSALFLFHKNNLKLQNETDQYEQFRKYKKAASIRLWVIGIAFVVGVVLAFFMHSQSLIFAAAIAAIALYFCKPTRMKIINDLDLDIDSNQPKGTKYV